MKHPRRSSENTPLRVIFQLCSWCCIWWWNTVSHAWYITSHFEHTLFLWEHRNENPALSFTFSFLFFPLFCLVFFFSLSPSAFTFKGHNSLMKSICGRTWRFDCMYFMRRRLSFYRAFNCICLVIRQTKGWIEAVRASPQQSSTIKI